MNESFVKNDISWLGEGKMGKKGKVINRKETTGYVLWGNKKIKGRDKRR